MIKKGAWVSLKRVLLTSEERTGRLPEETRKVPFIMWDKGYLTADAEIGETVTVITRTGREETGVLEEAEPAWNLGYGDFVPELPRIGETARSFLFNGESK